jgi:hypothetical protein
MKTQYIYLGFLCILFMFTTTYPQIISDFQVNDNGFHPEIAVAYNGNFIITWISIDGDSANVYARCFGKDGTAVGDNFKVNDDRVETEWGQSYEHWDQSHTVLSDPKGNFLIMFMRLEDVVVVQRYSNDGIRIGSNFNFSAYGNLGEIPSISSNGGDNFVITWYSGLVEQDIAEQNYVYAQRFSGDATALGDTFVVNDPLNPLLGNRYDNPVVSSDSIGNFVIAWSDGKYGDNYYDGSTLYAQRFAHDGTALGSNFKVNETAHARRPRVSTDMTGNFMITYAYTSNGYEGVYGQRYRQDGTALGSYFKVSNDSSDTREGLVSIDVNGNFLITWVESDSENIGYAQRYLNDGSKIGNKFINKGVGAKLRNGLIYNTWEEDNEIWANVLDWENPTTGISDKEQSQTPSVFMLSQNYPNPFNPTTAIQYQLPEDGKVTLEVYNLIGQHVKTLVNQLQTAGIQHQVWDGTNDIGKIVPTGVYFYQLRSGNFSATRKMLLIQ